MAGASHAGRRALLAAIGAAVQSFQEATEEVDEAAAGVLGLNRTDMRCLSVLARVGTLSASRLADTVGLTRAAMTTALDRLEAAGYARRVPDPDDRRGVRVETTASAQAAAVEIYGPIAKAGERLMQKYSVIELAAIARFLEEGHALQRGRAKGIREMARTAPRERR